MRADDFFDDREAEAGVALYRGVGRLEDPVSDFLGNTGAIVCNVESVFHLPDRDCHALTPVVDGISDEILEELLYPAPVADNGSVDIGMQRCLARFDGPPTPFDKLRNIDRLGLADALSLAR